MCLMEKIHILDKLSSGMSHGAVDCEFDLQAILFYIQSA